MGIGLLQLNDDCLLELFKYVSPRDKCNIKDSCYQLRKLANYSMKIHYQTLKFELTINDDDQLRVLCKFGKFVSALEIYNNHRITAGVRKRWITKAFSIIHSFCNPKLKSLKVFDVHLTRSTINCRLSNILPHLEKIQLYGDYDKSLLTQCTNANEISVSHGELYGTDSRSNKSDKLRSLRLQSLDNFDFRNMTTYLELKSNVKRLVLIDIIEPIDLQCIIEQMPNLESIGVKFASLEKYNDVHRFADDLSVLHRLDKLRCLSFNCDNLPITCFLNGLIEKNALTYFGFDMLNVKQDDRLCASLCKLTNLRVLYFCYTIGIDAQFTNRLSAALVNLEELYFFECHKITLLQIYDIVKSLRHLKKLYMFFLYCEPLIGEADFLKLIEARKTLVDACPITIHLANVYDIETKELIANQTLQSNKYVRLLESDTHQFEELYNVLITHEW